MALPLTLASFVWHGPVRLSLLLNCSSKPKIPRPWLWTTPRWERQATGTSLEASHVNDEAFFEGLTNEHRLQRLTVQHVSIYRYQTDVIAAFKIATVALDLPVNSFCQCNWVDIQFVRHQKRQRLRELVGCVLSVLGLTHVNE